MGSTINMQCTSVLFVLRISTYGGGGITADDGMGRVESGWAGVK